MAQSSPLDSRSSSIEKLHVPIESGQEKFLDSRQFMEIKHWQDYAFFGSTFFMTCLVVKRVLGGNISESLAYSGVVGTVIMGKAYTDDALGKYELSLVTQTLEGHVGVLLEQNEVLRKNNAEYHHQNDFHKMNNRDQFEAVEKQFEAVLKMKAEVQQLEVTRQKLDVITQKQDKAVREHAQQLEAIRSNIKAETQKLEIVRQKHAQQLEASAKAIAGETKHLQEARKALLQTGENFHPDVVPSPARLGSCRRIVEV